MIASDQNERCQNHPDQPVTARCVRFNRRFCERDFAPDAAEPAECLSAGTYCEYRQQCLVWAKVRRRRLNARAGAADALSEQGGGRDFA